MCRQRTPAGQSPALDRFPCIKRRSGLLSIQYETTYVGPNNAALVVNKGTIPLQLVPGEERNAQIRDVLYPDGTAWYKFRIIGATPTVQ